MKSVKEAVLSYTSRQKNNDGAAVTPVNGFMMKCLYKPSGDLYAIHRPAVFLILQGAKRMIAGKDECTVAEGHSVIVSANIPVVSRIVQATRHEPYLAVRIELEIAVLRELAAQLGRAGANRLAHTRPLLLGKTESATMDCVSSLIRLLNCPAAIPLLRSGIMRELHYWLLTGQHAAAVKALADPHSHASHVGAAIVILRTEFRCHIPVERLAEAASMSLSAFHMHFKRMTALTPGQYQKRLRLIDARRLMLEEGHSASSAAFAVGYESVSQFTREYGRFFDASPKRDVLRRR
jgi:AraC-like DNA-binding protein